ncbi:MAG TPA: DUF933 domain-containing protein [archaeon]|nr:DUF933 domain-containing protein [archaeon]
MKIGLIGYPLSGKTTVFNTLTGLHARTDSFISSGKEANVGLIKVPDTRLDRLTEIFQPKKITHAEISFLDTAGITTTSGGGFDPNTLSLMRTVEAFTYVIRDFIAESVTHPLNRIDSLGDISGIDEETKLADLIVIEKRQDRIAKEGKKSSPEYELLERCRMLLDGGTALRDSSFTEDELKALSGFGFLSLKPRLILLNTGEEKIHGDPALLERHRNAISFCAKVEQQITELEPEEQKDFLEVLDIEEPARDKFIRTAYELLNLICFFTVVSDELRAWTIHRGTDALHAAGKIHSDMERGFIRAEVVAFSDFIAEPSLVRMKELGKLRLEGKNYIVEDGDIIKFRFNV